VVLPSGLVRFLAPSVAASGGLMRCNESAAKELLFWRGFVFQGSDVVKNHSITTVGIFQERRVASELTSRPIVKPSDYVESSKIPPLATEVLRLNHMGHRAFFAKA
jgi:hypothetical protein